MRTIKCLSIRQPYASWLCSTDAFTRAGIEPKTVENRDWYTRFRGEFLIHASRTFEHDALSHWCKVFPDLAHVMPMEKSGYPLGVLLGSGYLVNVVSESKSKWFVGEYGFVLANAHFLAAPIPYRGQLSFFDVPLAIVEG